MYISRCSYLSRTIKIRIILILCRWFINSFAIDILLSWWRTNYIILGWICIQIVLQTIWPTCIIMRNWFSECVPGLRWCLRSYTALKVLALDPEDLATRAFRRFESQYPFIDGFLVIGECIIRSSRRWIFVQHFFHGFVISEKYLHR